MIGRLAPPEGWRDRGDAGEFAHAVARLAYAEAEVLRVEDRLRATAPEDDHWEALHDWQDAAYTALAALGAAKMSRDDAVRRVEAILIRWHDEERARG